MAGTEDEFKFPDEVTETKPNATAEPEVEIEVVDDTPEADRNRRPLEEEVRDPTDEELAAYSERARESIKRYTHKAHDERRRADALQRERDELERVTRQTMAERDALRKKLGEGAVLVASQAKTMAEVELAQAKAELKAALEAFDTDATIAAQEKMYAAQLKKDRAENFSTPPSQTAEHDVESAPTVRDTRPQLDEKTSTWMSRNKWFGEGGDEAMTGFALGLHQKLVKQHGEAFTRTDAYYAQIDKAVRQTFPDHFRPRTQQTSVVAPASRVQANGPRKVQLTATQVALAKKLGMTPQQYAAEVVKLEKEDANG